MARYSDSASPDEAVLIETDDFALVYDRQNRAFRKKLWNSSTKSWTTKVAPYSALVAKDGSTVWAEDASGKTIASGESGVDDASVIQSAVNLGGVIFIKAGDYILNQKIGLVSNLRLIGEGIGKTNFKKTGNDVAFVGYDVENVVLQDFYFDAQGYESTGAGGTYCAACIAFQASATKPLYNIHLKRIKTYNGVGAHIRFGAGSEQDPGDSPDLENTHRNVIIERVICEENPSTGTNPTLLIESANGVVLRDCYVKGSGMDYESCIALDGKNIWAYNCKAEHGREAIRLEVWKRDLRNIHIIGGEFKYCRAGVDIYPNAKEIYITGAKFYRIYGRAVATWGTGNYENIRVENCLFVESGYPDMGTSSLEICGDSARNIVICKNIFVNNGFGTDSRAICIFRGDYVIIKNNIIIDDRSSGYPVIGIEFREHNITNVICTENLIFGLPYGVRKTYEATVSGVIKANITDGETDARTASSGTATFSGDGSTTQFSIAHGLVSTPTKVLVTPMTADAASDFYVTADDTNIYINYKSAPPSGTDNLKFSWYAEV